MAAKLGQLLISANIISEEQLREAMALQRKEGGRIGANLIRLGYLNEEKLVAFLSKQFKMLENQMDNFDIPAALDTLKAIAKELNLSLGEEG